MLCWPRRDEPLRRGPTLRGPLFLGGTGGAAAGAVASAAGLGPGGSHPPPGRDRPRRTPDPDPGLGGPRVRHGWRLPGPGRRRHRGFLESGRPELSPPFRVVVGRVLQHLRGDSGKRQRRATRWRPGFCLLHLAGPHPRLSGLGPGQLPESRSLRRLAHDRAPEPSPRRSGLERRRERRFRRARLRHRLQGDTQAARGRHSQPLVQRLFGSPRQALARAPPPAADPRPGFQPSRLELEPRRHLLPDGAGQRGRRVQDLVHGQGRSGEDAGRLLRGSRKPEIPLG